MNFVELTEELVKSIVNNPDSVSVKRFETDDEDFFHIEVLVDSEDMGLVIGKEGKIIKAIRTIVSASGYVQGNKKIKIEVDSF